MPTTEAWYASHSPQDTSQSLRYTRNATGAQETLEMLRDAEQVITERASHPELASNRLMIFIDEPLKLFADERHGLLLQARAQSLVRRAGHRSGVRVHIRW